MTSPQTDDQWRWAEALAIEKQHGPRAAVFVAERIGALALAGDEAGVERMKQIAARLDQLTPRVSELFPALVV